MRLISHPYFVPAGAGIANTAPVLVASDVVALVKLMREQQHDGIVQLHACAALACLLEHQFQHIFLAAAEGACEVVIGTMRKHAALAAFQIEACRVLENLFFRNSINRELVVAAGGLEVLLHIFQTHSTDLSVCQSVKRVILQLVSGNSLYIRRVASMGHHDIVLDNMSRLGMFVFLGVVYFLFSIFCPARHHLILHQQHIHMQSTTAITTHPVWLIFAQPLIIACKISSFFVFIRARYALTVSGFTIDEPVAASCCAQAHVQ
jgi:hypothetical protein